MVAFVAWLVWTLDYAKPFRYLSNLWLFVSSEQHPIVLTVGGMLDTSTRSLWGLTPECWGSLCCASTDSVTARMTISTDCRKAPDEWDEALKLDSTSLAQPTLQKATQP